MIAIIDYGMGNLRSVEKALQKLGHAASITSCPSEIVGAGKVILPGVGAFGAAMSNLDEPREGGSLSDAVRHAVSYGKPFLGICLGMQLLFAESEEMGRFEGLDVIPGTVLELQGSDEVKVPHMGWNELRLSQDGGRSSRLLRGVDDRTRMYFVHSYFCRPSDPSLASALCDHGGMFCAALERDNLFGAQFHPEKSGAAGLRILDNFARM